MSDESSDYVPDIPFKIDNAELAEYTLRQILRMGFDCGRVHGNCEGIAAMEFAIGLKSRPGCENAALTGFAIPVHSTSANRCIGLAQECGYELISRKWANDDWVELVFLQVKPDAVEGG